MCNIWPIRSLLQFLFTFSLAGYDKLKPYGFPIHGCICGFSRKILWLEVVKTNNDPRVTARLFLDAVMQLKGCPMIVRSDCGTENGIVAATQCSFRASGNDAFAGERSHIYGPSHSNHHLSILNQVIVVLAFHEYHILMATQYLNDILYRHFICILPKWYRNFVCIVK